MNSGKFDYTVEWLRWLAIIGVVVIHANFVNRYSDWTISVVSFLQLLVSPCVIMFFWVSGFVSPDVFSKNYIIKRIKRLMVPYLAVSFLSFIIMKCIMTIGMHDIGGIMNIDMWDLLNKLLSGDGFGPQMYFLPYLCYVSVGVACACRVMSITSLFIIFTSTLIIRFFFHGFDGRISGPGIDQLILYILSYILGYMMKSHRWIKSCKARSIILFGAAVFVLSTCFSLSEYIRLLSLICAPAVYLLVSCFSIKDKYVFIKNHSPGAIYLWHTPILLPALSVILHKLGIVDLCNFIFSCVFAMLISIMIGAFLKKLPFGRLVTL